MQLQALVNEQAEDVTRWNHQHSTRIRYLEQKVRTFSSVLKPVAYTNGFVLI